MPTSASAPGNDPEVGSLPLAANRTHFRIVEIPAPSSDLDYSRRSPGPLYDAVAALDRAAAMELWGYDDLAGTARDIAVEMTNQEYVAKRRFAAVGVGARPAEERLLGHLIVLLPRRSNTHLAEIHPVVRPQERRRGVGGALLALGEQVARDNGRTVLNAATEDFVEPPEGSATVSATTGSGRVRADHPGVRFAVARGWTLEQYERHSVLELVPADLSSPIERLAGAARAKAGADYRLHTWTGPTPERWVDDVAVLMTRMSTDPPLGGLDYREDPWDAARVRDWERECADQGEDLLVSIVEHIPSGTAAGFTLFSCPTTRPEFVWQGDTLVLAEHRGRSLGMLVKTANLAALRRLRPGTRRVHTGNAEENRHMLAINVALGFRPAGGWGQWQRELARG